MRVTSMHNQSPSVPQTPSSDHHLEQDADVTMLEDVQFKQAIDQASAKFAPWFSILSSVYTLGFLVVISNPDNRKFYSIADYFASQEMLLAAFLFVCISCFIDINRYRKYRQTLRSHIKILQQHLDRVWQSKKRQQRKANAFSGHAEKLKSFISDKLLEYIEYDEKFIHFKGIAAEIRHNGVISYDKAITALTLAIDQETQSPQQSNQSGTSTRNNESCTLSTFQNGLDSMRYLWDLLDLSTADNIGIHIGNQLIECEERYYQLHLDSEKLLDITQSIPTSPTFHPQIAVLLTLSKICPDSALLNLLSSAKEDSSLLNESFLFENEWFRVKLDDASELLGNHNHIVLLLESLIRNAQFFSSKCRFKQKHDRISINLSQHNEHVHFSIYNRGRHIEEKDHDNIFKLGFTTRQVKQYHGKGLGLYFAQEIIRGYQGSIDVKNITNYDQQYDLVIVLNNGNTVHHKLSCLFLDGHIKASIDDANHWKNELLITSNIPISSVIVAAEAPSTRHESPLVIKNINFEWLDPENSHLPTWVINIRAYKRIHKLNFKPLDINGVRFDVKLATAHSRLNDS